MVFAASFARYPLLREGSYHLLLLVEKTNRIYVTAVATGCLQLEGKLGQLRNRSKILLRKGMGLGEGVQ